MKTKYIDLIEQTFDWPQEEFGLNGSELLFHGIDLMELIERYGTPLKFTYLPVISQQIRESKRWFKVAMAKHDYKGDYYYCYVTKSNHFEHVLHEVMKHECHLETSSGFDIDIVRNLFDDGQITKDHYILCNGYKKESYLQKMARLIEDGFHNCVPVLDNMNELAALERELNGPCQIGIRIASEEEPKFEFYTSRLGIGYKDIVPFYKARIQNNPQFRLRMLHFFINTGIRDTAYYWNELHKCMNVYAELKKICPELDGLDIGGGFPIKNSLGFAYDYEYMADMIIEQIALACNDQGIPHPNIFTEFGSFTVGESGGIIYSILDQKQQNDREKWDMIDSSFMTTLPDSWAISKRFLMLPINRWDCEYERIFLGGLTCDSDDYYNSEQHANAIYLPKFDPAETQYIGFFHTGAYQDTVGGFGGLQHCLTPQPKYVLIDKDEDGEIHSRLFAKEQTAKSMLRILGYI